MRKFIGLFLILNAVIITACSSDDDRSSSTTISLVNTRWNGTGDDVGEYILFNNATEYIFSGEGGTEQGTYTFNGNSSGSITNNSGTFNFTISGNVLTLNAGDPSTYVRQN